MRLAPSNKIEDRSICQMRVDNTKPIIKTETDNSAIITDE